MHPERAFPFVGARATLSYEGGAKDLIRAYKDGDELRLDAVMASLICRAARGWESGVEDWVGWAQALAYVPSSPEALKRRGFDHVERIARICSERTGLELLQALESRSGALDQRGLGRDQRMANRTGSFSLARETPILPARILLIDDVLTTGATASAATHVLLAGGAQEVAMVTCARVW